MKMENIRIEVKADNYIVVIADTKRFGNNEVMFEGNTFDQCFNYIKRELGIDKVYLTAYLFYESYTDREGKTFPWMMWVR